MLYYFVGFSVICYVVALIYFFLPSPYVEGSKFAKKNKSVAIVVLGDIGRSPRMQYHALSLAKLGYKVQLIGYAESKPHESVLQENITIQALPSPPRSLLKVFHQIFFLFLILGYGIDPPRYVLVQTPPAVPTLFITQLICRIRRSKLIIDWHNLGYTLLQRPRLKLLYKFFERTASAAEHLTVSHAMADFLRTWEISARVLHDRPPTHFRSVDKAFLKSFPATAQMTSKDRLVVSSTSWTPDENFDILLEALQLYDTGAGPKLYVIITGKGRNKDMYLQRIAELDFNKIEIHCPWLSAEDYTKVLGCADIGVCLHTSSSGLDLPMKVVDMFGCGVPVLAVQYDCIHELVIEGLNGRTFHDSEDLAQALSGVFEDGVLATLKAGAKEEMKHRWDDEWDLVAKPLFS